MLSEGSISWFYSFNLDLLLGFSIRNKMVNFVVVYHKLFEEILT